LAPSVALAGQRYRCRSDGRTRTSCCCGGAERHAGTPDPKTGIQRAPCCDLLRSSPRSCQAPAEPQARPETRVASAPAPVAPVASVTAPVTRAARPAARATAPPEASAVPLFVVHRALLL